MTSHTIEVSEDEEAALQFMAGTDASSGMWLENYIRGQLADWVLRHKASMSAVSANDVSQAYLLATPEKKQQVLDTLGLVAPEIALQEDPAPWMPKP